MIDENGAGRVTERQDGHRRSSLFLPAIHERGHGFFRKPEAGRGSEHSGQAVLNVRAGLETDQFQQKRRERQVFGVFRGQPALRLPLEVRRERVAVLLDALAELTGGAKKALHYGDRVPTLIAMLPMAGGVNPLGFVIDGAEGRVIIAGQGAYSAGEFAGTVAGDADGAWDRDLYVESLDRLRALEPLRVYFSHDTTVWEPSQ